MKANFPFDIISHNVPVRAIRQYPHAILDEKQDLFISVKQYIPKLSSSSPPTNASTDPITIIAAAGLGFIKELYEPLFADILQHSHAAGISIRAIWIADMFNVGESAMLNRDNLGCDPGWFDHSRDLFTIVTHFRVEMMGPIFGLGHSMGCNQLVYLSHWHPRLFQGLVCVESGCDVEYGKPIILRWMLSTLKRKAGFDGMEEAQKETIREQQAERWDERVKERLVDYGFREGEDGRWWTMTPKEQLAALVGRPNQKRLWADGIKDMTAEERVEVPDVDPAGWNPGPVYQPALKAAWDLLPHVRPRVLYINGGNSPFFGRPKTRDERAGITGTGIGGSGGMRLGAVEQVVVSNAGHDLVFDRHVNDVAQNIVRWLGQEVKRWQEDDKKRREEWQAKSVAETQSMPEGFEEAIATEVKALRKPKL